jgi:Fe-S-cluster containining protein
MMPIHAGPRRTRKKGRNVMSCLCDKCAALCCRYIALPIDNPETLKDYDNIRWYLIHENIVVFVEKRQWYVSFFTKCKHLQTDNRCGIYFTRPKICRGYDTNNCDWHGGEYGYTHLFTSAEQLCDYVQKKLGQSLIPVEAPPKLRKRKSINGKRRLALPLA